MALTRVRALGTGAPGWVALGGVVLGLLAGCTGAPVAASDPAQERRARLIEEAQPLLTPTERAALGAIEGDAERVRYLAEIGVAAELAFRERLRPGLEMGEVEASLGSPEDRETEWAGRACFEYWTYRGAPPVVAGDPPASCPPAIEVKSVLQFRDREALGLEGRAKPGVTARDTSHGGPREGDPHVVLAGTGEPLYQLVTRREYIETLDRLLDSIDLDMAVVNRLGKVIVWNRSMARTWGDKDSALGADIRDLVPPLNELYRGYRLGEALIDDVVGRGATIDVQRYPARLPTGALELFDLKAYPLRGRGDAILGAVLVLTDVTERVRLEQQLVRHARTTSLADLGAQLAHEIRNPLNSLQLNVELIQEGLARDAVDRAALGEIAGMVIEEARRLNGLVTHFLEFARPAAPKFALESPREAIETAVRLLAEEAKRRSIAIDCQLPPFPECNINRHQLQQVVYNIALNAIQWSAPGGTVEVRAWVAPDHVRIRVADTGPGIPPEALDRLFDLFYSRREGGTGLGLSIANRIVEAHGGQLVATNREEGGAAFTIDLPCPGTP